MSNGLLSLAVVPPQDSPLTAEEVIELVSDTALGAMEDLANAELLHVGEGSVRLPPQSIEVAEVVERLRGQGFKVLILRPMMGVPPSRLIHRWELNLIANSGGDTIH